MQDYLDNAPCVFISFTEDGKIVAVNQTVCELLGYNKNELLQKDIHELVTLGTRIFFQTHFFPLLRLKGSAEEIFVTLICQNQLEVPVILNVNSLAERKEFLAIGLTIFNRSKYEAEIIAAKKYAEKALLENKDLQLAKAQLQQHATELDAQLNLLQQQNESLEQLSWSLTHTMQEPLRKIALFTSRLLSDKGDSLAPVLLQKINSLAVQSRQLFVRLQEYLQMGLNNTTANTVDLHKLMEQTAQPFINDGHSINLHISTGQTIDGFEKELEQLFYQLMLNAVQFRKQSGPASIEISAITLEANTFRMMKDKYNYARYLKISVADGGIGFNEEFKDKIFGLFAKLNQVSPGFGMGLALCKRIMELHNGYITTESTENSGSVFHCFFPIGIKQQQQDSATKEWPAAETLP